MQCVRELLPAAASAVLAMVVAGGVGSGLALAANAKPTFAAGPAISSPAPNQPVTAPAVAPNNGTCGPATSPPDRGLTIVACMRQTVVGNATTDYAYGQVTFNRTSNGTNGGPPQPGQPSPVPLSAPCLISWGFADLNGTVLTSQPRSCSDTTTKAVLDPRSRATSLGNLETWICVGSAPVPLRASIPNVKTAFCGSYSPPGQIPRVRGPQ